jgi:hypothetical protein
MERGQRIIDLEAASQGKKHWGGIDLLDHQLSIDYS